jgi:hypothetical protein
VQDAELSSLEARFKERRTPKWRDATVNETKWSVSLRSRTILSRQSIYSLHGYRTYRASLLRSDYSEIELDLRTCFDHYAREQSFDHHRAAQVVEILDCALPELELAEPNLDVVDGDLGRARRLMVWVKSPEWIEDYAAAIEARLRRSRSEEARVFELQADKPDGLRSRLVQASRLLDRIKTSEAIDNGLQVRRLERIRNVGYFAVPLLIVFAPILVSRASLSLWNLDELGFAFPWDSWLTTIGVALLGAIGALLSGLLQIRRSPVTFTDYEVRGIEIALRIEVGSAVAVTLYYLLSWQVLPAIAATSAGTFLLVAFAAGFSERYFLNLLGIDDVEPARDQENGDGQDGERTPGPTPTTST